MEAETDWHTNTVMVHPKAWDAMQADLTEVVGRCNDIVAAIGAHQIEGKYEAETLLEQIEAQVRELRKMVEEWLSPI